MPPLSRTEMEEMAFKAIMGTIGVGNLSCDCPTCMKKSKSTSWPTNPKRPTNGKESPEKTKSIEPNSGQCNHSHHHHHHHHQQHGSESGNATTSQKSSSKQPMRTKATPDPNTAQGRSEKINNLLRAESMSAVFDVFNATMTSEEENKLVTQIQQVTKDSKTYPDSKTKIVELCENKGTDANAVFGLLAKFRHERNLLTTAILKSNTEREKALLCIKRVDDLMYMLQEAAKRPKDSNSDGIMVRLSEIIMEVHDLAKNPSALYEELLDIKEEHMQLLDDHDDMHQKFMEVNTCHDKLHANHDKLQSTHTKLLNEHTEIKKKSSLANSLKNDVARLEKAVVKKQDENTELKREVDKLNAELAKVNALKHEVAQLKKKVTTLSIQAAPDEAVPVSNENTNSATQQSGPASVTQVKKKKGKKAATVTTGADNLQGGLDGKDKSSLETASSDAELKKLKTSHDALTKELGLLRENLAQIDRLRRSAEASRDKAVERLQLEQATSQNWQEISGGHAESKAKLEGQLETSQSLASTLQLAVTRLEQNLKQMTSELVVQKARNEKLKKEQNVKPQTTMPNLGQESVRLLHQIKIASFQLAKDIDDSMYHPIDLQTLVNMVQIQVHRVTASIEKNVEEILGTAGHGEPTAAPAAVLPFSYQGANHSRDAGVSTLLRMDGSPRSSPHISSSFITDANGVLPHRPMIPPGFGQPSPSLALAQHLNPIGDIASARRVTATPSSTSSVFNGSPILSHNLNLNSSHGPIGSRVPSSSLGTSSQTKNASTGQTNTPPPSIGKSSYGVGQNVGLGNGAAGVDWSMWSKATR